MQLSAIILSPSRDASFYRAAYDAVNFIAAERACRHANASTSITGMIRRLLNRNICHHLARRRCPTLVSGNPVAADFPLSLRPSSDSSATLFYHVHRRRLCALVRKPSLGKPRKLKNKRKAEFTVGLELDLFTN